LLQALFLSLVFFCFSVGAQEQDDFAKRLREASDQAHRGDFSVAMANLEAAVRLEPANAEGWYQLGLIQGQIGDFSEAEATFRRAIQLKPELAEAHYSLGLTLIANPKFKLDWPGAILELREALKYIPEYPEALNLLGAGLTNVGEIDAAIPELQRAIRLRPAFAEAHFNLAIAFEKNDRLEEALTEYRAALAAKGDYPEVLSALGKLELRMGRNADSERDLERALRMNPDLSDAYYALARVLQMLGKTKQSAIELETAKDLSEREIDAIQSVQLSNRGLEFASQGDFKQAESTLRNAIRLKPDYGVPHFNLGLILADQGDLPGAIQELSKAISLLQGQSKPWFELGRVLKQQGKLTDALDMVSWASRLAPSEEQIRVELQSLQKSMGPSANGTKEAIPARQPKVGAAADTPEAHLVFADDLAHQMDFQGAVGELLRSLALRPSGVEARKRLAEVYLQMGQQKRASLEYYKLIRLVPNEAETHIVLGKVLLEEQNPVGAAEEFRMALKIEPDSQEAKAALAALQRSPDH
jgi:tetratricopeptide (TPR) repeat protein